MRLTDSFSAWGVIVIWLSRIWPRHSLSRFERTATGYPPTNDTIFFVPPRSSSSDPVARRAYRCCSRRGKGMCFSVSVKSVVSAASDVAVRSTSWLSRCWTGSTCGGGRLGAPAGAGVAAAGGGVGASATGIASVSGPGGGVSRAASGGVSTIGCVGAVWISPGTPLRAGGTVCRIIASRLLTSIGTGRYSAGANRRRASVRWLAPRKRLATKKIGVSRVSGSRRRSSASRKPSPSDRTVSTMIASGVRTATLRRAHAPSASEASS